ncbi:uncharacterized protein VTP21DRAFT_3294 [Calcarisporiella thermophila]|uniref:uncharacterized protein n=1 Tax=Calcarisporiella thermophila TaxID=911321 RepID=UPI0037434888
MKRSVETSSKTGEIRPYVPKRKRRLESQPESVEEKFQTDAVSVKQSLYILNPHPLHFDGLDGLPRRCVAKFVQKDKVNKVRWSLPHAHLLASAGADGILRIYDALRTKDCVREYRHDGAVRDFQWSGDGQKIASGGYDKKLRVWDVEKGVKLHDFAHDNYVTCLRYHPTDPHLLLAGMHQGGLVLWDCRAKEKTKSYPRFFGQVQDVEFLSDPAQFLAASDYTVRNSADKAIMVMDVDSGCVLSNQIYQEAYTPTALRVLGQHFVAQTNGDYIAIFSAKSWRMNKRKRLEGHRVAGFPIQCEFSPEGRMVASGSSDGAMWFYDFASGNKRLVVDKAHEAACIHVAWAGQRGVVASCGWDNMVKVWR